MIAALAALSGLLLLGYGMLRTLRAGWRNLAHHRHTYLRIALPPRKDRPVLTLVRGPDVLFGPVMAQWNTAATIATACGNASRDPALPGGDVPAGRYHVMEAADISGAAEPIRRGLEPLALILQPEKGGRDILLHGVRRNGLGSGGVAVLNGSLEALLQQFGNPHGLRVEIERRDIRRGGWGSIGSAAQRR